MTGPLIVSVHVDDEAQRAWDEIRRTHFPAERLVVGAHLTLFHALPPDQERDILAAIAEVSRRAPFRMRGGPYRSLGRGVALAIDSADLADLHAGLRRRWHPWLTRQDAQPFRPHVTVQNKVDPDTARTTLRHLSTRPPPADATALGLSVWHYAGGPWTHLHTQPFDPDPR
ncbi:2'-5' RNA ligase family protein [Actinokineospora sp. 24-640]